jgi:hypothetical protein
MVETDKSQINQRTTAIRLANNTAVQLPRRSPVVVLARVKVALSIQSAHPRSMAKTWISKTGTKSARAFAKAMRALQSPRGGRGNYNNRPR